jgi:hypothetical protein
VKAATRILGLRGNGGGDGAEAALLFTPTMQGLGLGMAAGKTMDARRLNEGLGSHDDAHAAALWGALRNANKNGDVRHPTVQKMRDLNDLTIVAHGGGAAGEAPQATRRTEMTEDDLPLEITGYATDPEESKRLTAQATVSLAPTKVLHVPSHRRALDEAHYSLETH